MDKKCIRWFALCLASLVSIFGCADYQNLTGNRESGALELFLDEAQSSKTLAPSISTDVASYDIFGVSSHDRFAETGVTGPVFTKSDLDAGVWLITVKAKNPSGEAIAVGLTLARIAAKKVAHAEVTLDPLFGRGGLDLSVTWEDDLAEPAVEATLRPMDRQPIDISSAFTLSGNSMNYANNRLLAGYYTLVFKLKDGEDYIGGFAESIRILARQTTNAVVGDAVGASKCLWLLNKHRKNFGTLHLTILTELDNPIGVAFSGWKDSLPLGAEMAVSVEAEVAADSYHWYLNGESLAGAESATISVGGDLKAGDYRLDCLLRHGEALSSGHVVFTVVEPEAPPRPILFSSAMDGGLDVYSINEDGTGLARITNEDGMDLWPALSPDGTLIAFVSSRGGDYDLYLASADGSGVTRLTASEYFDEESPDWSPDGCRIAFTAMDYDSGIRQIFVMNADGTDPIQLTDGVDNWAPDWSPDGSKICFTSIRDGDCEVYVMDADGSNQLRLTDFMGEDFNPRWSPDGLKIAYQSYYRAPSEVWVMNADGSDLVNLSANDEADDSQPAWSPDGGRIAFLSNRDGNYEIYLMDADGSNQTRLTATESDEDTICWF